MDSILLYNNHYHKHLQIKLSLPIDQRDRPHLPPKVALAVNIMLMMVSLAFHMKVHTFTHHSSRLGE